MTGFAFPFETNEHGTIRHVCAFSVRPYARRVLYLCRSRSYPLLRSPRRMRHPTSSSLLPRQDLSNSGIAMCFSGYARNLLQLYKLPPLSSYRLQERG